jgi:hypothetical protein
VLARLVGAGALLADARAALGQRVDAVGADARAQTAALAAAAVVDQRALGVARAGLLFGIRLAGTREVTCARGGAGFLSGAGAGAERERQRANRSPAMNDATVVVDRRGRECSRRAAATCCAGRCGSTRRGAA